MLIFLKKSCLNDLTAINLNKQAFMIALQNIAQSKIQGDHIFLMERGTTGAINLEELGASTANVLKTIESEAAQYGFLKENLSTYIEIDQFDGPIQREYLNSKTIIHIPLQNFSDNRISLPVKLIGENLNDCRFYERLASLHIASYKDKTLPKKIKFELVSGGGNTTAESLKELSNNNKTLTLCITDNDKVTPHSNNGETSKLCSAVALNDLCHHHDIDARYIENLLHYEQIYTILSSTKETKVLIKNLEFIEPLSNTSDWFHLPLKTGLKKNDSKKVAELKYWNSVINNDFDAEYKLPTISVKLLKWVIEFTEDNCLLPCPKENPVFDRWEELSSLISSWGCCSERMRV